MKTHLLYRTTYRFTMMMLLLFVGLNVGAQALTGVKTIPGSYSTLKMAIDSLNAFGAGTGGVTFNIAAGYTETLSTRLVVTATGTVSNPIVFQKSGVGANPVITAYTGVKLASSTDSVDVMWAFEGSDYVTVDGIDLSEAGSNTTPTTQMEVGIGFYKVNGTDGANNNTVQNCTITLNRENSTASAAGTRNNAAGSVAIEMINATRIANATPITVTAVTGASSNNKFYGNTLQNCNFGILLSGYVAPSPYTLADLNNDIGGNSALTGNTIINFGGGTGATVACGAILINNQWSFNISYNTINNNNGSGVNHPVSNRGIWLFASSVGASCDITNNKITITAGAAVGSINWCLDFEMAQTGANGNTINILNNQFLNCNNTSASTAAFTTIWLNTGATNVNVIGNYIYGFRYSGTGTTQCILSQFACVNLNISNNTIDSVILDGATASGTHHNIGVTTAPTATLNINDNSVTRINLNTVGSGSKILYGIYYTGSTPINNFIGNTVNDFTRNGTTGSTTIGIYQAGGTNGTSTTTIRRNTVSNLSISGSGATSTMYGIQATTGTIIIDSNTVFNISCQKTSGTSALYGIYDGSLPNNENCNYNTVYNLTHSGTGVLYGIYLWTTTGVRTASYNTIYNLNGNGTVNGMLHTSSVPRIFNNKIYDITTNSTSAVVSGISLTSSTAGTTQIYNNLISGINAPLSNGGTTSTVRGISLTTTTANTTLGLYNNTILLSATSTGANFSSAGVFHTYSVTATSASLDLRNNIIINNSTPNGTGRTVALWRSAATDLNNFNALSNRNLFYAGTPGTNRLIYHDGTNSDQTLLDYVTRVTPRDTNSVSENPTFLSTTGSSAQFLKLDPSVATFTESAARNISGITVDFANNVRAGNTGYAGLGGAPDMGAWEADNLGQPINQMVFDSASVDQQTGVVPVGSSNNVIVRVRVYADKGYNALEASSFKITAASTSSVSDITQAKIYYTGNSATFATTDLYGTTPAPGTSFYVTGSKRLALGVNYFWLVYDVSNSATPGNFLDASVDSIVLSGVNQPLLVNDPAGNRSIAPRLNGNYNVGVSQTYPSLTAAMSDLSLLGVSGPVTFTLTDPQYDSLSTAELFPINLNSYVGSSPTNTVTILPQSGVAARIVTIGSNPVFLFNGASNYIIDGRQGGVGGFVSGNNLIIENTSAGGNAISFVNDADSNLVWYADVKGANTLAAGNASAGVINFGTTTGTVGNDYNTIRHCDIHESAAGFPAVAISSIGSGTSVAVNNVNNIIDSNNIYNFFSATVASAGIYVGANNGNWQINSNKFYQTAARTYTTAAITHRVLWITPNTANLTSASGFTISNNYIGGDNSSGSGLYDVRGNTTYQFNPMDISVGLGAATVVQGNTITNISDSTTATASNAFVGINIANGNVDVLNNLIGSRTINGAISFYLSSATVGGAMGIRTGGGSNNTINISGNIISGFDLYGSTATTTPEFFGLNIFNGTNINVSNNMVGDTSLPNSIHVLATSVSSASLQRVSGIFNNPSATAVHTLSNNVIANITNDYAGTSASHSLTKGIVVVPTVSGTYTVTGNSIRNISTASQTTGTGYNATLVGLGVNYTAGTYAVSGNTISGLTLTGTSTTATVQNTGIFYSVPTTGINTLTRNTINSQTLTALNPFATLTGVDVAAGNGVISNNMIRLGIDGFGVDITTACTLRGITKNAGNASIYFNTVYIGGSGVGADFSRSFAFQRTGAGTDDVRNNIFHNSRTNATTGGGHFAVGLNNNTTLTQTFNLLQGDSVGLYNGIQYDELNDWKVGSGVDAASITASLAFVNANGNAATVNLHLDTTVATPIEAYGVNVTGTGTDVDFDGQTRSGLTPVDLGADAGNFIPSDIAAPVIAYTALINTSDTTDRTLTATITDATGVYTTGGNRPRIYFKKMYAGSWFSNAGTLTAGSATNGTWQFTISSITLGGLAGDDSVYYYVVAQDSTIFNNLGSTPGGAEGSVNAVTSEPAPLSYKITPTVGGITYPVGTGETFTNLTGSNGIFNYLNSAIINGDITIQITSDIEETGLIGLNELNETGVGGYKVRIEPSAAVLRNITGTYTVSAESMIRLNGADRVKVDGSFGGSGRYLRFMNRSTAGATFAFQQDADNDTLTNCIIEGVNNTVGMVNFWASTKVGGTGNDSNAVIGCLFRDTVGNVVATGMPNTCIFSQTAFSNNYNTIDNNELYNFGYNCINLSTTGGDFWTISNNKVYQTLTRNVGMTVFQINGGSGHVITNNSIGGGAIDRSGAAFTSSVASTIISIATTVTNTNPIVITNNTISNLGSSTVAFQPILVSGGVVTVSGNTVGGGMMPYDTITTNGTSSGIHYAGGTGSSISIDNNLVSNINFLNASTLRNAGISATTTTSGAITISNNIVRNISGLNTGISTATARLGGIVVTSSPASGLSIVDNTVSNIQSTNTGAVAYAPAGIMVGATGATYSVLRNRINLIGAKGTGTGTSAPIVYGIHILSTPSNCVIANNQISIGDSAINESRVYGIGDAVSSGTNLYAYNSVFINGTTAAGVNNSYALFRSGAGTVNAFNNILYNKRTTLGTGNNYAAGSVNIITSTNLNYNLCVVADTSKLLELAGAPQGWAALNTLYTASPNTNWAERTSTILPQDLFIDTLIGNLGIVTTNPNAWYANGKGIALANISGDFANASSVRSTSIATGSTDIGSVEFNPSTFPPVAFADNAPTAATTSTYYFGSRAIAKLQWDIVGSLPTAVDVRYYSGINPANMPGGKTNLNTYWDIQPVGGSGYEAVVTLMADSAVLGTVGGTANLQVANYTGVATEWRNYTSTSVNSISGLFNTVTFTDTLGIFTGTDGSNNPLPVNLINFAATVQKGNVMVDWSTASETNNRGFEVERSLDGRTFTKIGFVKGAGNSNTRLSYVYNDPSAFAKTASTVLYYRLKQLDMNGTFTYSQIAKVSIDSKELNAVSAYPNPFNDAMQVSFRSANEGVVTVRILNIQGMVVSEQNQAVASGMNRVDLIGLSTLDRGMYFVQLTINGETTVVKMMKN